MRWKGSYSDTTTVAWDLYDDYGLIAYAIKCNDGTWKVRINHHLDREVSPYLILDDDPKIFMPHLLMTLAATQRK